MKCQVKGCEGRALVGYGGKWICGDCMVKILNKQREKKKKEIEELENDNN